jgi:hypothetical protein
LSYQSSALASRFSWEFSAECRVLRAGRGLLQLTTDNGQRTSSSNAKLIHLLQRRSASTADHGPTVAANERVVHFSLALWAIERFGLRFFYFAHAVTSLAFERKT